MSFVLNRPVAGTPRWGRPEATGEAGDHVFLTNRGGRVAELRPVTQGRRRATLRFAREQLAPLPLKSDGDQPEAFGQLAAALSRKISHDDNWIAAAAITERRQLLTQDANLAEQAKHATTRENQIHAWLHSRAYRLGVIHIPRPPT